MDTYSQARIFAARVALACLLGGIVVVGAVVVLAALDGAR